MMMMRAADKVTTQQQQKVAKLTDKEKLNFI